MDEALFKLVDPLLATIDHLSEQIGIMDEQVKEEVEAHPESKAFLAIPGIGPIIALAFFTCIDDPHRFKNSRQVGALLGLRSKPRESGTNSHQGPIIKEGDGELRSLLVQGAHAMLRSRHLCALKSLLENLIPRIGKRKAVTALARKRSVVMHRMRVTRQPFMPFPDPS